LYQAERSLADPGVQEMVTPHLKTAQAYHRVPVSAKMVGLWRRIE
jgi:hypothetical protein